MIRRIVLVALVALAVLAVVGDRLALSAAERAISIKAGNAARLKENPSVTITGFPFLTQAIGGKYAEIRMTAHDIHRDGLRIDTVKARFHGVHVGLGAALAGRVGSVRIDRADGSLLITYADLNAFLAKRQLTVTAGPTTVRVSGSPVVGGQRVHVDADYAVGVSGRNLQFVALPTSIQIAGAAPPAAIRTAAAAVLAVSVDTGSLPFGLMVHDATIEANGIVVDASAQGLLVPVPADAAQTSP